MLLGVFNFGMEVGMELVKIYGKILGSVRSDINFRLNGDVRMITLIGKEWEIPVEALSALL